MVFGPMFPRLLPIILTLLVLSHVRAEPPEWSANPDEHVTIKTLIGQMRYDVGDFEVEPGAKIKMTLDNVDDLQHNLVLLKKGANATQFALEMWNMGEAGIEKGWVQPGHSQILAASRLLNPHEAEDLYFVAPNEPGDYPYVCTVPGHALLMNGKLKVRQHKQLLKDLKYTLYEGNWDKVPDFSALQPKGSGQIPNGLMDAQVVKKNGAYGLVFAGKLILEKAGNYEFFLTSDDGSRLVIDGEGVVDHDGVHPAGAIQKKKIKLQEGEHSLELRYFDKGGHKQLSLTVNGPGLSQVPLTKWTVGGKPKKKSPNPIMVTAENPGEAVIYRNFIDGSNPRGIGVGYPGGVNICWDADAMNVAMLWRGGFMDASRHWTNRGQGNQKPAGYDVVKTAQGLPLQVLKDATRETWIRDSKGQVAYDRDKPPAERKSMRTFVMRHPDYRFRGYRLDAKRFPTFRYDFQDLQVKDRFEPAEIDGKEAVLRTIEFTGAAKPGTHFRIADNVSGEQDEVWYHLGDVAKLMVEGGETPFLRLGKELLVEVKGESALKITYAWKTLVGGKVK